MEKPRKTYCKEHPKNWDAITCRDCFAHNSKNKAIDAMSTWIEGEVPTLKEITKAVYEADAEWHQDYANPETIDRIDYVSKAIHALLKRKLTGKQ